MKLTKVIGNGKEMFEIYSFNVKADRYGYKHFINTNVDGYSPKWEEVSRHLGIDSNCVKLLEKRIQEVV